MRADVLLKAFYENCSILYGDEFCGLNVHNLKHYVPCVRMWGPLWAWSCFGFESLNGEILRSVHGTGNVCSQIFWSMQAQKHLELETEKLEDGDLKSYFVKQLRSGTRKLPPHVPAYKCEVVTPIRPVADLTEDMSRLLTDLASPQIFEHIGKVLKILRNGFIFYSKCCVKVKKRNSFTALLESQLHDGADIVKVDYFLVDKQTMKVFVVGTTYCTTGPVVQGRALHVQNIQMKKEQTIFHAELLMEPVVHMMLEDDEFVARFPNFVERD
jgi:hypothetical protein